MEQTKSEVAWNLFLEARKAILTYQTIRTQMVGFKITFLSAGVALIAAEKAPLRLFVVAAFAAVFFDFLISSYSFAIKRTGFYCLYHLEPIIRGSSGWPGNKLLWEEFMCKEKGREGMAQKGNIGMTLLMTIPAIYSLFAPPPERIWISWAVSGLLGIAVMYDIHKYRIPKDFFVKAKEQTKNSGGASASA
jgi:hypothetical protein